MHKSPDKKKSGFIALVIGFDMGTKNNNFLYYGAAYGLGFTILYFIVYLLIPPIAAISFLNVCMTAKGMLINVITSPISYLEIVYMIDHDIYSLSTLVSLVLLNFITIALLIYYSFIFFSKRSNSFNPHKIIWSSIIATYIFSLINILFHMCGTGTSIIGISLSTILLAFLIPDLINVHKRRLKLSFKKVVLFSFIMTLWISYFLKPVVHLFGLLIFLVVLSLWDRNFRYVFIAFLSRIYKYAVEFMEQVLNQYL